MTRGRKNSSRICCIAGCDNIATNYGHCGKHWHRVVRHGSADIVKLVINKGQKCKVEFCSRSAFAKGYCQQHYDSVHKHGREYLILAPKGSGYINKDGYMEYNFGGEKSLEHIILAEKALGRKLPPKAVVHHMNGVKDDNFTPFNLVICPDQTYHMLLHARERALKKKEDIEYICRKLLGK